jgi:hypothetical protein
MPMISIFYGIAIRMFIADHSPPHFHVVKLVQKSTNINRNALNEDWKLAQQNKLPKPIGGLDAE